MTLSLLKKKYILAFYYLFLLSILFGFPVTRFNNHIINLTQKEKEFIKRNPEVKVAIMKDYMPFSYTVKGKCVGLSVDILDIISRKTGLNFKVIADEWYRNLKKFKTGKVEIITDISYLKEREKFTRYTKPYYEIPIVIFGNNSFGIYKGIEDLKGKKVGVLKDIFYEEQFKENKDILLKEFDEANDLIKNLAYGKIDACVISLNQANMYIQENGFINIKILGEYDLNNIKKEDLRIGVTKNNPVLFSIINKAFNSISEEEMISIRNKWISLNISQEENEKFTDEEIAFIKNKKSVDIAMIKNFRPFSFMENNLLKGFSVDLIDLISQKTGLKINFIPDKWYKNLDKFSKGKIDLIDCISYKRGRTKFTQFTKPYYKVPIVVFARTDFGTYSGVESLIGKKIGIIKDVFFKSKLESIQGLDIVEFKDTESQISALSYGNIDVAIGDFAQGTYFSNIKGFVNLKIVANFKIDGVEKEDLRIGVINNNKVLYSIINKGLNSISDEELNVIKNKWFDIIEPKEGNIKFTDQENEFIKNHRVVKVGSEMDWLPYDYVVNDQVKGFSIDYLKLLAKKIGINLKFVYNKSWNELETKFKNKQIDVLPALYFNEERKKYTNYTKAYQPGALAIFTKATNNSINKIDDLNGKTIAMVKGYGTNKEILKLFPKIKPVYFDFVKQALKSVSTGKTDATINYPLLVYYYAMEKQITNLKIVEYLDDYGKLSKISALHIGIRKDWGIFRDILEKAMNNVSENEFRKIKEKWKGKLVGNVYTKKIKLSPKEKEFISEHPIIRIENEKNYVPYNFYEDGEAKGYTIDYLKLLVKKIGIKLEIVTGLSWDEYLTMLKNKKLDVIGNIVKTPERSKFALFTKPIYKDPPIIFCDKRNSLINNLEHLKGKVVAVHKGYWYEEILKRNYPQIKLLIFENNINAIKSVYFGKADAIIGKAPIIQNLIIENGFSNIIPTGPAKFKNFEDYYDRIGIRQDWPILKNIIEKAMNSVTFEEKQNLKKKWVLNLNLRKKVSILKLTYKEKEYLNSRDPIKMGVDPNWMPYEAIDTNGKHIGIVADYFKIFQERIGKKIEMVPTTSWNQTIEFGKKRKCDIFSAASETPERLKYMNFTTAYISFPTVIVTKSKVKFIGDIRQVQDKKFAAIKDYAILELLHNKYPNLNIVPVNDINDGFQAVNSGEVFGYIGALPPISYQIQKSGMLNLKIAGKVETNFFLSIGVRNDDPILLGIMQKAIDSITDVDRQKINNKWLSVNYENSKFDYSLFWKILAVIVLIIIIILFWNRRLHNEIKIRKNIEFSLKETLSELKIAKEKAEDANKTKSEFLANVSHELRTPLNAVIGFSELLSEMMADEKQKNYVLSIKTAGKALLTLINDILDLSKIESGKLRISKGYVNINNLINEMEIIFKEQLKNKGIDFQVKIANDVPNVIISDEIRLRQILLNLMGNAQKFTEKGRITIEVKANNINLNSRKFNLEISVADTGIGISKKSLNKIFEAFQQQDGQDAKKYGGTGLGLSISKKLTKAMGGELQVFSELGKGSKFNIYLENVEIPIYDIEENDYIKISNRNYTDLKVVLIGNDDYYQQILRKILANEGISVVEISNLNKIDFTSIEGSVDFVFCLNNVCAKYQEKILTLFNKIPILRLIDDRGNINDEIHMNFVTEIIDKTVDSKKVLALLDKYLSRLESSNKMKNSEDYEELNNLKEIKNINKLLIVLNGEIATSCKTLKKAIVISEVKSFGNKMVNVAEEFDFPLLRKYGNDFIKFADFFDTDAIESSIEKLENLIKSINETYSNRG